MKSLGLYKTGRRKAKTIKLRVTTLDGKKRNIRIRKNKPKGCSQPRRICIKCQTAVIHKLDKNYDSKICKSCS